MLMLHCHSALLSRYKHDFCFNIFIHKLISRLMHQSLISRTHTEPYTHNKNKKKVEVDLSNYVTKSHLKNAADVDTSEFVKKADLANLKSEVDKLEIGKLKLLLLV